MNSKEPNSRRSGYAGLAQVFAEGADRRDKWELALKGWNVRESVVVNRWKAEAQAEGRAEGQAQGRAEGRAEGQVVALIAMLEEKFGAVPEDLANAIRACTDTAKLRQWIGAAVHAETLAAFRTAAGIGT